MNLKVIFQANRWKFALTLLLILLEAGLTILFPLFIGSAIDGALGGDYGGAIQLGLLALSVLVIGVGRRVFDSRFYARVFERIAHAAITKIEERSASLKSARLGMIRELIEFLENSLPELISNIIGLVGVIVLIATLNLQVFYGSLLLTLVIFFIYWLSSKRTVRFNKAANDLMEQQVDVLKRADKNELRHYLKQSMRWNIKLSDLEAVNFSMSWVVLTAFLVLSIIVSVQNTAIQYGVLVSLVMYVFQYMENVLNLPLFYQNWLRLKEIMQRMESI